MNVSWDWTTVMRMLTAWTLKVHLHVYATMDTLEMELAAVSILYQHLLCLNSKDYLDGYKCVQINLFAL